MRLTKVWCITLTRTDADGTIATIIIHRQVGCSYNAGETRVHLSNLRFQKHPLKEWYKNLKESSFIFYEILKDYTKHTWWKSAWVKTLNKLLHCNQVAQKKKKKLPCFNVRVLAGVKKELINTQNQVNHTFSYSLFILFFGRIYFFY